jgi:hypothetical protein
MMRTLSYALLCTVLGSAIIACSGGEESTTAEAQSASTAQSSGPPWSAFQDQGALFLRAGRSSGLVMDSAVTLLGAPVAGTSNRRIIGFGNVAEVWDDLVRIDTNYLEPSALGTGMVARRPKKSDLAVVTGLPKP